MPRPQCVNVTKDAKRKLTARRKLKLKLIAFYSELNSSFLKLIFSLTSKFNEITVFRPAYLVSATKYVCVCVCVCVCGDERQHSTTPKRNEVGQEDFFRGLYMRLLVTLNCTPQQTHVESCLFNAGYRNVQFL
jgi:hypothetical protein